MKKLHNVYVVCVATILLTIISTGVSKIIAKRTIVADSRDSKTWVIKLPQDGANGEYVSVVRVVDDEKGAYCYIVLTNDFAPVISCVRGSL